MAKVVVKKAVHETATGKVDTLPPPLETLQERMEEKAGLIIKRREIIAAQTKELDALWTEVADYMHTAKLTVCGNLERVEYPNKPVWYGATGKELENKIAQLKGVLPSQYMESNIKIQDLFNDLTWSKPLSKKLTKLGLTLQAGEKIVRLERRDTKMPDVGNE
jgi:hypothetical protein